MPYTIEVYEYEIKDYHRTKSSMFGKEQLCAVPCGTVTAYPLTKTGSPTMVSTLNHSCDLLESSGSVDKEDMENGYNVLYTHFPTKISASELASRLNNNPKLRKALGYKATPLIALIDTAITKMDVLSQGMAVHFREEIQENLRFYLLGDSSPAVSRSYLLHLPSKDQVIVMGDLHGSFHTFWRNLLRLHASGILLSLRTFTLKCGYAVIFTGDVVDRGNYSLDIIMIILRMISSNPSGKVIYNRGNHEEKNVASRFGFSTELDVKLPDACDQEDLDTLSKQRLPVYEGCRPANYLLYHFQRFWASCPCAVVLENADGERIWFSHGGIPFDRKPTQLLPPDRIKTPKVVVLDAEQTNACMWYDFFSSTTDQQSNGRARILPPYVIAFMVKNKLSFIIRGHQDNYVNTYLLSTYIPEGSVNAHGSRLDIRGRYGGNPNINVYGPDKTDGPIARIVTESSWTTVEGLAWETPEDVVRVWPVLTVSTATDSGRKLVKDSMLQLLPFKHLKNNFALRCPIYGI